MSWTRQPIDINSRWSHNWKSAQVVNSHVVWDPTIHQPGFDLPQQQWSPLNRFRTERVTAVPVKGNGDLQTLICVLVARPKRCATLSNPVLWQSWMAAYPGYILQIKTLFLAGQSWFITCIREEEEIRSQMAMKISASFSLGITFLLALTGRYDFLLTKRVERRALLTFVSTFDQFLIDVPLSSVFQDVEETQVDSVRLFQDDVQQRLGGFNWTICQRLNRLQVSECQRVTLIHVHSHDMRVQFCRQVPVLRTKYVCTFKFNT